MAQRGNLRGFWDTSKYKLPETLLDLYLNLFGFFLSFLRTPRIGQSVSLTVTSSR